MALRYRRLVRLVSTLLADDWRNETYENRCVYHTQTPSSFHRKIRVDNTPLCTERRHSCCPYTVIDRNASVPSIQRQLFICRCRGKLSDWPDDDVFPGVSGYKCFHILYRLYHGEDIEITGEVVGVDHRFGEWVGRRQGQMSTYNNDVSSLL